MVMLQNKRYFEISAYEAEMVLQTISPAIQGFSLEIILSLQREEAFPLHFGTELPFCSAEQFSDFVLRDIEKLRNFSACQTLNIAHEYPFAASLAIASARLRLSGSCASTHRVSSLISGNFSRCRLRNISIAFLSAIKTIRERVLGFPKTENFSEFFMIAINA